MQPIVDEIRQLVKNADAALSKTDGFADALQSLLASYEQLETDYRELKSAHAEAIAAAVKEREQRLRERQEHLGQLQMVMMMAADGIVTIDEAGIVETFNEAAGWMFGYKSEEVVGNNIAILLPEPFCKEHPQYLANYLATGQSRIVGFGHEVVGRRKDGTVFPLDLSVSEVCMGGRRIFTGIFRNVTERRMMEVQLRHAQKMESIGHLAAGIAHEINTPTQYIGDNLRFLEDSFRDLNALLSKCEQLKEAFDGRADARGSLTDVIDAAGRTDAKYLLDEIPKAIRQSLEGVDRVAKIVRSMKEFSHPGDEEMQTLDLNRAIESTLTVSRNEWKYVADVDVNFDPNLPMVTCLPSEINQVVLNLIVNAAQAIADKCAGGPACRGMIGLRTRRDGDWVEIRVKDNGAGIPPAAQPKIFQPFFTTKQLGRGTGQGLAICRTIVAERHGGSISFETVVGVGTTFIVRLPIHRKPLTRRSESLEKATPIH
jgi:two-component system, NtrC family, sensor kinase